MKVKLTLSERTYRCGDCGYVIDRDVNAAVNLKDWNPDGEASDGDRNVAGSAPETLNARGGSR